MAGFVGKFKDMWRPAEDEENYDDRYYEEEEVEAPSRAYDDYDDYDSYSNDEQPGPRRQPSSSNSNKVVNIHATAKLQVVLFKPERFGEETRVIADELMKMHTVLLNLENTNKDMARRIIDFLSGAAYANRGKINRVATNTYMITPNNVDLTGNDLLDELESNGIYF